MHGQKELEKLRHGNEELKNVSFQTPGHNAKSGENNTLVPISHGMEWLGHKLRKDEDRLVRKYF